MAAIEFCWHCKQKFVPVANRKSKNFGQIEFVYFTIRGQAVPVHKRCFTTLETSPAKPKPKEE